MKLSELEDALKGARIGWPDDFDPEVVIVLPKQYEQEIMRVELRSTRIINSQPSELETQLVIVAWKPTLI